MLRRVLLALLAAVGVTAAVVGIDLWLEEGPPDETVVAFLHAGTEAADGGFAEELTRSCPDCTLVEEYAAGGKDLQGSQLDLVLGKGADVVVLDAVDAETGDLLVQEAGVVPVVAVGTFVPGADHYVGHDARMLGRMLVEAADVPRRGQVLLVGASDPELTAGAESALGRAQVLDTLPAARADRVGVRSWLREWLTEIPPTDLAAVVTLDDLAAGEVVAALDERSVPVGTRPAVTGVGTSLAGLRRVVLGTQQVAGYVDARTTYAEVAHLAATLAVGAEPDPATPVDGVPTVLVLPQVATLETLTDTVVRHAGVSIDDLCEGETARRCTDLGFR